MLNKKSTSREKKRKNAHSEEQHVDRRRKCTESSVEDSKCEHADQELDEPGSNTEEGGLDLSVPFKPISAYVTDRREMLDQCFRVLGESKLQTMLPDELKSCSLDEIKTLCQEQLEQLSQSHLLQILEGRELTGSSGEEGRKKTGSIDSQQDNNVDSTSSLKESPEVEDLKQADCHVTLSAEGGVSEESDVLSINADTYDSDIEGHKDEPPEKAEEAARAAEATAAAGVFPARTGVPAASEPAADKPSEPAADKPSEPKKELQKDIDRSVSEILALATTPNPEEAETRTFPPLSAAPEVPLLLMSVPAPSAPVPSPAPGLSQPSAQQLELLELEMRARAIKALMKANDVKKRA
ncbi:caspase activity and apoptosis inhibitor 1 isoform X1 [Esox lucius]|uniref:Caspase activity and apoptosis inhibitor 1 n=1 Tax=Esox lucius TaxID=8010 RepID=A0AAY5KIE3_ESOLU|nr:caspase activity and apoptosis inhibitor 1 isoform X1 [Esox lucius]